jgi:hypothetical protein
MPGPDSLDSLSREDRARLLLDLFHRTAMHYGMWYAEACHQLGQERALAAMEKAYSQSSAIQTRRLSKTLGFALDDGLPKALLDMPPDRQKALAETLSVNWLANDGLWFQAIEFAHGMFDAKRTNDTCWTRFSPFEARRIKTLLRLPENPGLDGVKTALRFRLYAFINVQDILDEGPESFVFYMRDCRVQSARKRKGMEDYPCKSGGMAEYPSFARAIDPTVACECVGCPPDPHPGDWYCAWRFSVKQE